MTFTKKTILKNFYQYDYSYIINCALHSKSWSSISSKALTTWCKLWAKYCLYLGLRKGRLNCQYITEALYTKKWYLKVYIYRSNIMILWIFLVIIWMDLELDDISWTIDKTNNLLTGFSLRNKINIATQQYWKYL